jgi:hypothetical protein
MIALAVTSTVNRIVFTQQPWQEGERAA